MRLEAELTEYFYNDTQKAFAETRIVGQKLRIGFLGEEPYTFKPGMTFAGHVSVSLAAYNYWWISPDET